MSTSRRRYPARAAMVVTAVTTMAAAVAVAGPAQAAGTGLTTKRLFAAQLTTVPVVPTVYAWANFTGANNASLATIPLNSGQTWTLHRGAWMITTNRARVSPAITSAVASAGVSQVDAAVQATLTMSTTRRVGLSFNDDGTERLVAVHSNPNGGQLQLYKTTTAGGTVLLSTATGTGAAASATLRVEAFGATVRVLLNGTLRITYTLTAAEQAVLKDAGNSRFGLFTDSDSTSRLDDFRVESQ